MSYTILFMSLVTVSLNVNSTALCSERLYDAMVTHSGHVASWPIDGFVIAWHRNVAEVSDQCSRCMRLLVDANCVGLVKVRKGVNGLQTRSCPGTRRSCGAEQGVLSI
jgi:hypothetical protein